MPEEESHKPNSDTQTQPDLETALETYFNPNPVIEDLWRPSDSLGRIASSSLGIYALTCNEDQRLVANWTPVYELDRTNFDLELASFIREACDKPGKWGMRLADILTTQPLLADPVVSTDELAAIAEDLAQGTFGLDNLIMLSGLLSKKDLAILLARLPSTPQLNEISRNKLKMSARTVDNELIETSGVTTTEALDAFSETVQQTIASDEVCRYPSDILHTKIFLKSEGQNRVAMVRRIAVENFAAWMKVYSSRKVWEDLGFQHIPVEPILSFSFSPRHTSVDCRTVLLRSSSFNQSIQDATPEDLESMGSQKLKIKKGLDRCGVIHGHLHSDNLQVVMTDNGPQVYVIDFDRVHIKKDLEI